MASDLSGEDAVRTLCVLACSLRVEDGDWNDAFLERCALALGVSARSYRQLYRTRDDSEVERIDVSKELVARLLVSEILGTGIYDARARVAFRNVSDENLPRIEAAVGLVMKKSGIEQQHHQKKGASYAQYAKIGTVAVASGAAIAFTAGLAAPAVAAALATSSAWGATTLATFASTSAFAVTFGTAGGGLAGYRMRRRVKGLTDFQFFLDEPENEPRFAVAFCVAGTLRDKTDYAATYGLSRLPEDAPLKFRIRRYFMQKFGQPLTKERREQADALWRGHISSQESEASLKKRLGTKRIDAVCPPKEDLAPNLVSLAQEAIKHYYNGAKKSAEKTNDGSERMIAEMLRKKKKQDVVVEEEEEETEAEKVTALLEKKLEEETPPSPESESVSSSSSLPVEVKDDILDPPLWWWRRSRVGEETGTAVVVCAWECELLVEVTSSMDKLVTSLATSGAQEAFVLGASATAAAVVLSALSLPLALLNFSKYIDATWTLAVERADAAGIALADALCARRDIGARPATLIGYSLGARVVFSCLQELAKRESALVTGDEEEAEEKAYSVVALDGVHWLNRTYKHLRVCVRSKDSDDSTLFVEPESASTTSKSYIFASGPLEASSGEPMLWPRAKTATVKSTEMDILLVDDTKNYFSTGKKEILARGSLTLDTKETVKVATLRNDEGDLVSTVKIKMTSDSLTTYKGLVEHAILLGAPVSGPKWSNDAATKWELAARVVAGKFINGYSSHDLMLALCYRQQSWSHKITGLHPVNLPAYVNDRDLSHIVKTHQDYPRHIETLLTDLLLDD